LTITTSESVEAEEFVVGVPVTVTEPVAVWVGGIGGVGVLGCENWPQAAAQVRTTAHNRRTANARFQRDAGAQRNRAQFLPANTRINIVRSVMTETLPGTPGKGVPGVRGGLR